MNNFKMVASIQYTLMSDEFDDIWEIVINN